MVYIWPNWRNLIISPFLTWAFLNRQSDGFFDGFFSWAFLNRQSDGPHHVIAPMIMKFGTDIKLYVLYTTVKKAL